MFGDITTGAETDIQQVTADRARMVARWGMSEKVGFVTVKPAPDEGQGLCCPAPSRPREATQELVDAEVRRIVDEEHDATRSAAHRNRDKLDALAAALLERETLDEVDAYAAAGIIARASRGRPASAASRSSPRAAPRRRRRASAVARAGRSRRCRR